MKLISMTDFVLGQRNQFNEDTSTKDNLNNYYLIQRYAEFLKQPLTLGMFVPCGERYQNILKHPSKMMFEKEEDYEVYENTYEEAKNRVLFKDFIFLQTFGDQWELEHKKGNGLTVLKPSDNIEFLTHLEFKLELTESAIKQIGLNP